MLRAVRAGSFPARARHPLVLRALEFIERNVSNCDLTVNGVAKMLGVNASYLSHLFTEEVGIRMRQFITIRRLENAQKLLATTDLQIKTIALSTGHGNVNWFSHVFRIHAGTTPTQYRMRCRRDSA